MNELGDSLERMSFMQLVLLFGFVATYVASIGGLFGRAARLRAALLALAQAVGFAALTDPWVHGALMVVFVVAGMGLFVLLSWLLARLFGPREPVADEPPATESPGDTTTLPSQPASSLAAPKIARRARATR